MVDDDNHKHSAWLRISFGPQTVQAVIEDKSKILWILPRITQQGLQTIPVDTAGPWPSEDAEGVIHFGLNLHLSKSPRVPIILAIESGVVSGSHAWIDNVNMPAPEDSVN